MAERIDWIDMAKGFGIVLMVVGHMGIPASLSNWVYSFHMPLFLFLSGVVFNVDKYSLKRLVVKRIQQLIVPYLSFSIIVFIGNYFLNELWLTKNIKSFIIYGNQSALWFLPVLFLTQLIAYPVIKRHNKYFNILFLIVVFSLSAIVDDGKRFLPYNLASLPLSLFFFSLGHINKKFVLSGFCSFFNMTGNKIIVVLFWGILSFVFSQLMAPPLKLAYGSLGGGGIYSIAIAFLGLMCVFSFCFWSRENKYIKDLFTYVGLNTLAILGLSQVIYLYAKKLLTIFPLNSVVSFSFRIAILILALKGAITLINNYLPFIVGKNRKK